MPCNRFLDTGFWILVDIVISTMPDENRARLQDDVEQKITMPTAG
jgi:hypothetical protein